MVFLCEDSSTNLTGVLLYFDGTSDVVHPFAVLIQDILIVIRLITHVARVRLWFTDAVHHAHVMTQSCAGRVHFSTDVTRNWIWTSDVTDPMNHRHVCV